MASSYSEAAQYMDITYGITGAHLIKNTEWGALAYLTDSKYGRNGVKPALNTSTIVAGIADTNPDRLYYNRSGGGEGNAYIANVLQTTTGNIYGIYDLVGGLTECTAGYINIEDTSNYNRKYFKSLIDGDEKYRDVYMGFVQGVGNGKINYTKLKQMRGDAMYETSNGYGDRSWPNAAHSHFDPQNFGNLGGFRVGGESSSGLNCGVFSFIIISGGPNLATSFRAVYTP